LSGTNRNPVPAERGAVLPTIVPFIGVEQETLERTFTRLHALTGCIFVPDAQRRDRRDDMILTVTYNVRYNVHYLCEVLYEKS
jgi:hypothetical protein